MSNQKEIINAIIELLPKEPRSYDTSDNPGFWSDGTEILCQTETECENVADFLRDMLNGHGDMSVYTGYYDPFEDAKSEEQDDHTGLYYIDFD